MELANKKILVTGTDGLIGYHLTEKLVIKGYNIKVFFFYESFNSWEWLDRCAPHIRDSVDIFAGDIRDPFGVNQAVTGCDIIFHLAALIAIPYSYHSPATYVDTKYKRPPEDPAGFPKHNVHKMVYTSTSEVYVAIILFCKITAVPTCQIVVKN